MSGRLRSERLVSATKGRLTWNPTAPASFESGWSIFVKVLAHNYMVIGELVNLIRKADVPKNAIYPYNLGCSDWIDFEKFGELLEVNPARLKTGFLDQLGFYPHVDQYNRYKVRHCPICVELGYHCTLFDLAIVMECPWHRRQLQHACSGCGTPLTVNGVSRFMEQGAPVCPRCGLRMDLFLDLPELNKLGAGMTATAAGYCVELVDWWKSVRERTQDFRNLTEELSILEGSVTDRNGVSEILLGYARVVAAQSLYWKFSVDPWPSRYTEWITTLQSGSGNNQTYYSTGSAGKMYRSIRRHIYRTYIRPHRRCLQALMSLSRDDVFVLRGDKMCIVVLAYVIWRMSIEGVRNIEELRASRKTAFQLRLMGPGDSRFILPVQSHLRWCYFGFFGLWQKLYTWLPGYERIAIDFGESHIFDGFLRWRYDRIGTPKEEPISDTSTVKMKVIVPDPPLMEAASLKQPHQEFISADEFIDISAFNTQRCWGWTIDRMLRSNVLFQFTYSRWRGKSQFMHLTV